MDNNQINQSDIKDIKTLEHETSRYKPGGTTIVSSPLGKDNGKSKMSLNDPVLSFEVNINAAEKKFLDDWVNHILDVEYTQRRNRLTERLYSQPKNKPWYQQFNKRK